MSEENKALVRRWIEELNKGNLAVLDEVFASNFVYHEPTSGDVKGLAAFKRLVEVYHLEVFPDMQATIDDLFAEADTVVMRFTSRGTHKGELMGIAPTGKLVALVGIFIGRIVDGKFAEAWEVFDALGMMQQLGAVPQLGQAKGEAAG